MKEFEAGNHAAASAQSNLLKQIQVQDWANSPLGGVDSWPPSLHFTLHLIAGNAFPMFVLWGEEHSFFCNDAFHTISADNSARWNPGAPGKEVWKEAWPLLEPLINQAMEGQPSGLFRDHYLPIFRCGKPDSAYWNFSFSPVRDEAGIVRGVLAVFQETTPVQLQQLQPAEATNRLSVAAHSPGLGAFELDLQTMMFRCDEKGAAIIGFEAYETRSVDQLLAFVVPADHERVKNAFDPAILGSPGGTLQIRFSTVRKGENGQRQVLLSGRVFVDKNGNLQQVSGTVEEVASAVRIEQGSQKLQQLVEHSGDCMMMATLEGRVFYMNAAGRSLFGVGAGADLSSYRIGDFYTPDQYEKIRRHILPVIDKESRWSGQVTLRHLLTGEEIPCAATYLLIRDPHTGKAVSRSASFRDLRPEMATRKELEASETRFRNLVQEAPVATAIYVGEEMRIQWANDAMIRLWGKDSSVIGKTIHEALPELDGQPFYEQLHQVFTSGEMYQGTEDRGELVVDGELKTFYFNFSYKPLRNESGEVYGILNMAIDVTETVKNKRRIEESDKRFRRLIMQAPVGLCLLTGEDNVFEIANEQYLNLVGRTAEQVLGKPVWEVLPEAKEQGFDALLNNVRKTGEPYFGYEQPIDLVRKGNKERVYVNFVYEPLLDDEKRVYSVLVTAIDVSQQVRARHLVEEAEERARLAVQSANLGTYELNYETGEMFASARFNELFELSPESQHTEYVNRIYPDDLPIRQKAHEVALATGSLQYESRVLRKNGPGAWIQLFGQFYFNEEKKPYKVIGIAQDVTEQKRAEEEREKFLSLAQYSQDVIAMCDLEWKTLYVNRAGQQMLGMADETKPVHLWEFFFPEDLPFLQNEFFPSVQQNGHGETEVRFRHFQTGAAVWMIYSAFYVRDSKGKPSVMAMISRDITDRKNSEAELERRVAERTADLVRLNNELQQFTYVSSHDLREPLRKIQVFGRMAQQQVQSGDPQTSVLLGKVVDSASRMSSLLTDLLRYSTLSETEQPFTRVDLPEVLKIAEEDLELLVKEKGATIQMSGLPVLEGIPFQLAQLFINLLQNALKFSRPGVPAVITVEGSLLSAEEQKEYTTLLPVPYYKITVRDNGVGFKQEYAEKIFVVFQRLHDRHLYAGNGIGLSLCKKIVANHRGEIFATSQPGEGSVFTILLPARQS